MCCPERNFTYLQEPEELRVRGLKNDIQTTVLIWLSKAVTPLSLSLASLCLSLLLDQPLARYALVLEHIGRILPESSVLRRCILSKFLHRPANTADDVLKSFELLCNTGVYVRYF